jgi:hypothetical protein
MIDIRKLREEPEEEKEYLYISLPINPQALGLKEK